MVEGREGWLASRYAGRLKSERAGIQGRKHLSPNGAHNMMIPQGGIRNVMHLTFKERVNG